ncbi:MAG: DnaJ domain-containing protein [Fretibacterium sp.]|nr:DnaJ domain-containing protein [Fretibacterium sp.]
MGANLSQEISDSLSVLGLRPGASVADVRAAFRHLARACHPDVAGSAGAQRFQQITGAYALLKGLTPEELEALAQAEPQPAQRHQTLFDWYRKRRESELDEAEDARRETRQRGRRVDIVLEQYDQRISHRLEQIERSEDETLAGNVLLRLRSDVPAVRRLALEHAGAFANRSDVRQALAALLTRWEVDDGSARLVAGLPLNRDTRRRLAADVAAHAASFPNALLTSLLDLRQQGGTVDPALMERYLSSAAPAGIALILRHWPAGQSPADATLRHLLESDDSQVLVPVLSAMKQHFPKAASRHKKRLSELQKHPTPAVRVWGRALLS